jgi:hypothetical protein
MSNHPQRLTEPRLTVFDTDGEPVGIDVTLWRYVNLVTDPETGLPAIQSSYPTDIKITRIDDPGSGGSGKPIVVSVPVTALGFLADAVATAIEAAETAGFDPYGNKPPSFD